MLYLHAGRRRDRYAVDGRNKSRCMKSSVSSRCPRRNQAQAEEVDTVTLRMVLCGGNKNCDHHKQTIMQTSLTFTEVLTSTTTTSFIETAKRNSTHYTIVCVSIHDSKYNKGLTNAKRPCDCRVLCLRLKSSLCSCALRTLFQT